MTPLAGLHVAGCLLLVAAGAAKFHRPAPARAALAAVTGVRLPAVAVRAGGAAEIALGAVAVVSPEPAAAWAVATCYGAFAAYVVLALRRSGGRAASCGCFGDSGGPLHAVQAVVDASMAAAAVAVAAGGGLAAGPVERAVVVALGAAVAGVAYLALVPFPRLLIAVREATR